jgi:hypothetical protein
MVSGPCVCGSKQRTIDKFGTLLDPIEAHGDPEAFCPTAWVAPRRLYDTAAEGARAEAALWLYAGG